MRLPWSRIRNTQENEGSPIIPNCCRINYHHVIELSLHLKPRVDGLYDSFAFVVSLVKSLCPLC